MKSTISTLTFVVFNEYASRPVRLEGHPIRWYGVLHPDKQILSQIDTFNGIIV